MPVIKEYPRDSSYGVCFKGLREDCNNNEVNDATVLASVTDGDKNVFSALKNHGGHPISFGKFRT